MMEEEKIQPPAPPAGKKTRKGRKRVREILGGEYLSREWVVGNLPFLLFITVLAIVYIGNTYYAEKTFKEIEHTKYELKELRYKFISTKSELMYQSRQSEISKRASVLGLKEVSLPPYKILYKGKKAEITK
jgi:hypothetical protein